MQDVVFTQLKTPPQPSQEVNHGIGDRKGYMVYRNHVLNHDAEMQNQGRDNEMATFKLLDPVKL